MNQRNIERARMIRKARAEKKLGRPLTPAEEAEMEDEVERRIAEHHRKCSRAAKWAR